MGLTGSQESQGSPRLLTFDGTRFIFEPDTYQNQHELARNAGFVWNADSLRWATRNIHKAAQLRRFADSSAEQKFKKYFITEIEPPEQILYPDHLEPTVHQIESAWHCVTRTPAYCADEAGLGKTIMAVLCLNTVPGRAIIICPPFLKYNWLDEIKKWSVHATRKIKVIETGECKREDFDAWVVIVPDSLINTPAIQHYLKDQHFEWLFVDEVHRFKNSTAHRTEALIGSDAGDKQARELKREEPYFAYINSANRAVFLSGTPMPNGKPIELHPLISRTCHEVIEGKSLEEFGKRFCAGHQVTRYEGRRAISNWNFQGASNLKGLRHRLRSKFMIRHLKRDVLDDLSPKTRKFVFLDAPKKLVNFEKKLLTKYTLEELMGDKCGKGDIARYQKICGLEKLPLALEYIKDLLEHSPDKLIVFAHHIDVVEGLNAGLKDFGCLMIRGGMKASHKHAVAKQFQASKSHRVIAGNMDAMGIGLTLTKAPGVIVVEPSWVSGNNEQAEDRAHRMTQEFNVYIRYLVMRGTLDEYKLARVLSKEKNIKKVMG